MIDILNIAPHEISRDLCGYTVLLYGQPKAGKTTVASQFPDTLLLAFEIGYLAIPGVKALPINMWSEFKSVLRQLKTEDAHKMYKNIVIDTADIAYDTCEKFICSQNGVDAIGDIPYGQGWTKTQKEFDEALRAIPQMGYGLILISHAQDKTFTDENGREFNQIAPTLSTRPRLIIERMSDIIGYAHPQEGEDGNSHTVLYMRQTPRFVAGSRFKYTPAKIDFSYDNLVNAIGEAIDKQALENDGKFVTNEKTNAYQVKSLDYNVLLNEFNDIVNKLKSATGENFNQWGAKIVSITEKYLGKGKRVNELTPDQVEQLSLIVEDLKEEVGKGI